MSLSFHNLIPKSDIPINVDIIWKLASQRLQSAEKQNLGEKKSQKACKKETKPGGRPGAQGCQVARASLLATAHCSAKEHTQKHPDHSSPADALWSRHRSRRRARSLCVKEHFYRHWEGKRSVGRGQSSYVATRKHNQKTALDSLLGFKPTSQDIKIPNF